MSREEEKNRIPHEKTEAEISLVVLLSALFEQLQHWVREHLDHSGDKVGMLLGIVVGIGLELSFLWGKIRFYTGKNWRFLNPHS